LFPERGLEALCEKEAAAPRGELVLICHWHRGAFSDRMASDSAPEKASTIAPRIRVMIGKTIAHYNILEKLGEGGRGAVYKAEDTRLGRVVALKFLPAELTRDPEARNRFMQEARAASALDHPNICTIYEINEAEGRTYISMAYYDGETLKDRIARGPLKIEDALDVAVQIAQGLSRAHARGIVHRDIEPANVLITNEGFVKIVDFGVAKLAGMKLTKTGATLGTARYMSPEQARGAEVDLRSDIWSLGALLYEMIAGTPPFRGEYDQAVIYSILNESPEPVTALRSGVPMALERVVEKALAKSPAERYQHADDLIVDLRQIARSTARDAIAFARDVVAPRVAGAAMPPHASRGDLAPGSARPAVARRTRVLQITAIVVLAAAIIIAVYYAFVQKREAPAAQSPQTSTAVWRNPLAAATSSLGAARSLTTGPLSPACAGDTSS
jgi:serine/threonine protein kinase